MISDPNVVLCKVHFAFLRCVHKSSHHITSDQKVWRTRNMRRDKRTFSYAICVNILHIDLIYFGTESNLSIFIEYRTHDSGDVMILFL